MSRAQRASVAVERDVSFGELSDLLDALDRGPVRIGEEAMSSDSGLKNNPSRAASKRDCQSVSCRACPEERTSDDSHWKCRALWDEFARLDSYEDINAKYRASHLEIEEALRCEISGKAEGKKKHKKRKRGRKKKKAPSLLSFTDYRLLIDELDNIYDYILEEVDMEWDEHREILHHLSKGYMLSKTVKVNHRQYDELVAHSLKARECLAEWFGKLLIEISGIKDRDRPAWDSLRDEQVWTTVLSSTRLPEHLLQARRQYWAPSAPVLNISDYRKFSSREEHTLWIQAKVHEIIHLCKDYNKSFRSVDTSSDSEVSESLNTIASIFHADCGTSFDSRPEESAPNTSSDSGTCSSV